MLIHSTRLLKIANDPPNHLLPWLTHQSSLTEKLQASTGDAQLKILNQCWTLPNWWDKFMLGLVNEKVMHRDILMFTGQTACWYARTIIPWSTYQSHYRFFDRLKQETLGNIIFNEPKVKRRSLFNYAINNLCLEYYWPSRAFTDHTTQFWVRLSVFSIAETSVFYLVEILFPELMGFSN